MADVNIYASVKKTDYLKKNVSIDEDLTYDDEEEAVYKCIKALPREDRLKIHNGEARTVYLYYLNTDRVPCLFKSVEVNQQDGSDDDLDIKDKEEFDLPKNFAHYGEEEESDDDDDNDEETKETESKESEKDSKKSKKSDDGDDDEDEEEDDEEDSEDDAREIEEACKMVDTFFDMFETGTISSTILNNSIFMLEQVVGRKSLEEAKVAKKQETKDRKDYLKAHSKAMGSGEDSLNDHEKKLLKSRDWEHAWDKEDAAKKNLVKTQNTYAEQRAEAKDRLRAAQKAKREKRIEDMKTNLKSHMSHPKKPVTVEAMIELNQQFLTDDDYYSECVLTEAAIIAASTIMNEIHDAANIENSIEFFEESANVVLNDLESQVTTESEVIALDMVDLYVTEKTLKAKDRKELSNEEFGIPETRQYPIPDKAHVRAAIQRFNNVEPKYEKTLALNLIAAMKKFKMLNKVHVSDNNRFKQYLDAEYQNFKESYDVYPFPCNLEYAVGQMLPTTPITGTTPWSKEENPEAVNKEVEISGQDPRNFSPLYDQIQIIPDKKPKPITCESVDEEYLMYEGVLPKHNITFDGEVKKLMEKIKEFVANPKNDYMETILKKSLNYKKTVYTIRLKEQNGQDSNKVITKITSAGFKSVNDEGVKAIFDKQTGGILITLIYDTVADKIRVTYENVKERPKTESVSFFEEGRIATIRDAIRTKVNTRRLVKRLEERYRMNPEFIQFNRMKKQYLLPVTDQEGGKPKLIPSKSAKNIKETGGIIVFYDGSQGELKPEDKNNCIRVKLVSGDNSKVTFSIGGKFSKFAAYYKYMIATTLKLSENYYNDLIKAGKAMSVLDENGNLMKESFEEYPEDLITEGVTEKFRMKFTKFGKYVDALEKHYVEADKNFVTFDMLTSEVYVSNSDRWDNRNDTLHLASSKKGKTVVANGGRIIFTNNGKPAFECEVELSVDKRPGYIVSADGYAYGTEKEVINRIKKFTFKDPTMKKFDIYYKSKFFLRYNIAADEVFETLKRECIRLGITDAKGKLLTEASKEEIDDDIKPIIDILNKKGYNTKYSCSGHTGARVKEDGYRNGIYKGKLYTTARVVFDKDYDIGAPKGWKVKTFDGQIGIYPEPPHYDYADGVPDDAWEKWKSEYMSELKVWANNLGDKPGPEEDKVEKEMKEFVENLLS